MGSPSAPIRLFTRDEASGTRETFWKKLLKKGPIDAKADIVASNGAIKLDGAEPTQGNAQNGSYPVTRWLYMNTKGEPQPLVKAFIDYIKGPEGAKIIQKHGFIPLQYTWDGWLLPRQVSSISANGGNLNARPNKRTPLR